MNILFIIKVKFLVLIEWSYKKHIVQVSSGFPILHLLLIKPMYSNLCSISEAMV